MTENWIEIDDIKEKIAKLEERIEEIQSIVAILADKLEVYNPYKY